MYSQNVRAYFRKQMILRLCKLCLPFLKTFAIIWIGESIKNNILITWRVKFLDSCKPFRNGFGGVIQLGILWTFQPVTVNVRHLIWLFVILQEPGITNTNHKKTALSMKQEISKSISLFSDLLLSTLEQNLTVLSIYIMHERTKNYGTSSSHSVCVPERAMGFESCQSLYISLKISILTGCAAAQCVCVLVVYTHSTATTTSAPASWFGSMKMVLLLRHFDMLCAFFLLALE